MALEEPSGGDLPKLLRCEEGEWHSVLLVPNDCEKTKNDRDWSCYMVPDMDVSDDDGAEIDGTNEIPFWAMKGFYDVVSQLSEKLQKKEVELSYKRVEKGSKNTAKWKLAQ